LSEESDDLGVEPALCAGLIAYGAVDADPVIEVLRAGVDDPGLVDAAAVAPLRRGLLPALPPPESPTNDGLPEYPFDDLVGRVY